MQIVKKAGKNIDKVIKALKDDEVAVCPTDTVYGFLADATSKKAVEKIFKIKKRPKSKPLPFFVRDINMAKELAEINEDQEKILEKYWPGKYTFVLKRKKGVKIFGVKKDTVALRIPKYKFLNDLLKKMNKPLAQTSTNISGQPPISKIGKIFRQFGKSKVSIIIVDGGNLKKSNPSKVIDLTQKNKVLRK